MSFGFARDLQLRSPEGDYEFEWSSTLYAFSTMFT